MPLTLPNLDDLTWEKLVEEGRSLIPAYAPEWTNHNVADPGITLVELFAYLSEILVYRLNRISDANLRTFLKLIHGPEWSRHTRNLTHQDLEMECRKVLSDQRRLYRAVTVSDFEAIAIATSLKQERVVQARCLPGMNLAQTGVPFEKAAAPGHVSVVLLAEDRFEPTEKLREIVSEALDRARLLTSWIHVVGPQYVQVAVRLQITVTDGADPEVVRGIAMERLSRYFDPHHGGSQEAGWPLGRSIFISDIYATVARLPGVSFVGKVVNNLTGESFDEVTVESEMAKRQIRNQRSELEAMALLPNELVKLQVDKCQIVSEHALEP
ncbi:MAG TPA: baseplate J/gp47 family protein [Candidatus Eisenbacteria bacterium]|nr:baseplate J/gp47 family protein [Candidatus Eisenbacteria bacterium]